MNTLTYASFALSELSCVQNELSNLYEVLQASGESASESEEEEDQTEDEDAEEEEEDEDQDQKV